MNWFIFILMWLALPSVYLAYKATEVAKVRKKRAHDLILYAFCEVRDAMAIKAIRGEVDEDSELFRFFYGRIASLIHNHRHQGLCFNKLAKHMLRNANTDGPVPTRTRMIVRQIKNGDDEVKAIAGLFVQACTAMMAEASGPARIERRLWQIWAKRISFLNWLEKQVFLPKEERAFAAFTNSLAEAAHFTPRPWAAVFDLARAHSHLPVPA